MFDCKIFLNIYINNYKKCYAFCTKNDSKYKLVQKKKATLEKYITTEEVSRQFTFCPTTWNFTCTRTLPNQ